MRECKCRPLHCGSLPRRPHLTNNYATRRDEKALTCLAIYPHYVILCIALKYGGQGSWIATFSSMNKMKLVSSP